MKNSSKKTRQVNIISILFSIAAVFITGCNLSVTNQAGETITVDTTISEDGAIILDIDETSNTENDVVVDELLPSVPDYDFVPFNPDESFSYCEQPVCRYDAGSGLINFQINFDSIPQSDDYFIYLFEIASYEDDCSFDGKRYVASEIIGDKVTLSFPYKSNYLFSKFVPVIAYKKCFYPLSLGQYITNPEDIAANTTPYPEISSKKGILLDPLTLDKEELTSLNVKRVIYNLPLSFIMGETDNETYPTIDYEYLGKVYHFNGYMLSGFDSLFANLTENGYHITAIILNDWNSAYPEIIHPLSRKKTSRSLYYAFNTEDAEGARAMEAAALFLSSRYSGGDYGLIHDWVIANEINQQRIWNYMATDDLDLYMTSFEKSFRTFYNAIKANYKYARVYYSIDHDWNNNKGFNSHHFNGKDVLDSFSTIAKSRGDYDWGLSIHPYPAPLTNTNFWYGYSDKSENARVVTPMNLTVITDYMNKEDLLDTNGNVRNIGVTELGFSSKAGEKNQAAAFAYCYYIINDNEYINSFLMNRQTDSYLSLQSGLALGIYNPDYSSKYIKDVFSDIDSDKSEEYLPEMLKIIGVSSLDEALSLAK